MLSHIQAIDDLPLTDHSAVAFDLMASTPKLPLFKQHLYNYNKANFDAFNDVLSHTSWNFLDSFKFCQYQIQNMHDSGNQPTETE